MFELPLVRGLIYLHAIMVANGQDTVWANTGKPVEDKFKALLKRHLKKKK